VESEVGMGSRFWFTAEFEKQTGAEVTAEDHGTTQPTSKSCDRSWRILVAEDNITNQQVALAILEKLGCRADAVANGKEALESLRNIPYDLVLMDCQMPEMSGYEATAFIRSPRSGVRNPKIPIIALTAHAMRGDREECLASGMDDYIAKPVEPAHLQAILDKWLSKAPQPPAGEVAGPQPPVIFDESALLGRLMGDRKLARSIVGGFLDDIPKQLAALATHLNTHDAASATGITHRIKGAAASVSAVALREVAWEMEQAGKAGDLHAMARRLPELELQFRLATGAIRTSL